MIGDFLYRITEPALRPIRNSCPISAASTSRRSSSSSAHHSSISTSSSATSFSTCSELSAAGSSPWRGRRRTGSCSRCGSRRRGGRDAIDGIEQLADGRRVLKVRVRAAASEGEANAALVRLVARRSASPPRDVSLVAGATARIKRLRIAGARRGARRGAGENLRDRVIRLSRARRPAMPPGRRSQAECRRHATLAVRP